MEQTKMLLYSITSEYYFLVTTVLKHQSPKMIIIVLIISKVLPSCTVLMAELGKHFWQACEIIDTRGRVVGYKWI